MKKPKLGKKTYLIAFVFVMTLNAVLAVFLYKTVIAQTVDLASVGQSPLVAISARQANSPLLITITGVDNSNVDFQIISYTLQNTGGKAIRGYVVIGGAESPGKIVTDFLPTKSFQPNAVTTQELAVERANIKSDKPFALSVDYIEFDDGSVWGEDSAGNSAQIDGGRAGAAAAAGEFIDSAGRGETAEMLKKPLAEIEVRIPETFKNRDEKWQTGFRSGYKGIIGFIKKQPAGGEETVKKLVEIRKNLQIERRQK